MRSSSDRTVHGRTTTGADIARYDRSGKWYVEGPSRRQVAVGEAARLAAEGTPLTGKPGGSRFDALVQRHQEQAR